MPAVKNAKKPPPAPNPRERLGGNKPPSETEILQERLEGIAAAEFNTRLSDLTVQAVACSRIETDDGADKAADLLKRIGNSGGSGLLGDIETKRVSVKEPFLTAGRAVDTYLNGLGGGLRTERDRVKRLLDRYLILKEERARKAAQDEAKRAEDAALAAEKAAKKRGAGEEALSTAVELRMDAEHAAEVAEQKPADFARVKGASGRTATLRTSWTGELVSREKLDLEALRPHIPEKALEQAIRAFVSAGGRELKGAKIFEEKTSAVL